MGMQGNLRDMAIAELIQLTCQDRKTAQLKIDHSGQQAILYFMDGNVAHAVLGNQTGEEVVYQILRWEDGVFDLKTGVKPPKKTITRNWSGILLEGAKRLDENKVGDDLTPIVKNNHPEDKGMAKLGDMLSRRTNFMEFDRGDDQKDYQKNSQKDIQNYDHKDNDMSKMDDILKEMSGEITGYVACALVGLDGINIASHTSNKAADPDAISAQLTMLLKLVDATVEKLGAGIIEDNLTTTESAYILMRFLPGKQYYLGMAANRKTGNLGNLRLISKLYTERLAMAMPS